VRIFLSYSSADRPTAERINLALQGAGHDVFFDRASLPPGDTFDMRIIDAVDRAEFFIFLISPEAIAQGAYTLTELGIARRRWPRPGGRVLPVMLRRVEIASLPPYLRAVTILVPEGEIVSEVVSSVDRLAHGGRRRLQRTLVWTVPLLGVAAVGYALLGAFPSRLRSSECHLAATNTRLVVGQLRDFAPTAARRENEILAAQHDEKLSGTEHAAAASDWSDLVRADNQRMEALLADARRVRDDLVTRCRLPQPSHPDDWNMPAERLYARRLGLLLVVADSLDGLSASAQQGAERATGPPH
jgi:hypothetical protein